MLDAGTVIIASPVQISLQLSVFQDVTLIEILEILINFFPVGFLIAG